MEGLIPMAYRATKNIKIRQQYEHLDSGESQSCKISDLYVNGQSFVFMVPSPVKNVSWFEVEESVGHRRNKSFGDLSQSVIGYGRGRASGFLVSVKKQLVRLRSLGLFSCVTGAA